MVRIEDYQQPLSDLVEVEDEVIEQPEVKNENQLQLPIISEERTSIVRNQSVGQRPSFVSRPSVVSQVSFQEPIKPTVQVEDEE